MSTTKIEVQYRGPQGEQTFSKTLPPASNAMSVESKTDYLSDLRSKATQVQGEINAFLTQKMEEEKDVSGKAVKHEEREEEMYGEEDPEADN